MLVMIWQWILGAIVALVLCGGLWAVGSFIYLKLHYRKMSEKERSLFADLDKEQRTPRSDSL